MFYGPAGGAGAARGRAAASFGARGSPRQKPDSRRRKHWAKDCSPDTKCHEHEPRTRRPRGVYAASGRVLYGSATGHGETYV